MATDPRQTLAQYVFLSKYARYRPDLQRRETYTEAVDRVMDMHYRQVGDRLPTEMLQQIRTALVKQQILPSQRTMQFAGPAIERIHLRGYNCSYGHFNRMSFLSEAVWLLLCGCGVGFSVQRHHVAQLPALQQPSGTWTHLIGDSIEGWADAFAVLFESYLPDSRGRIRFDYSRIRPEGAALSTSSAMAPGPKPLRDALDACQVLLDRVAADGGVLRPIDAYDLVMHAASCVRAGGIRRSATIALFSPDDVEMAQAKTGDWFDNNPQRRLSNNSAVLVRKTASRQAFDALIESTQQYGEPGFLFVDDAEDGTNPCQPGFATVLTPDGVRTFDDIDVGSKIWSESGWTTVVRKWSTGIKPVKSYRTTSGVFIGTDNHRVVQRGVKTPVCESEGLDCLEGPPSLLQGWSVEAVVDGLMIGDGMNHRAGGGPLLCVGAGAKPRKVTYDIVAVDPLGEHEVFDITVDNDTHTYWTGGVNVANCGEISLQPTIDEESGWAFCNLTSVNVAACRDQADFLEACIDAGRLGTIQASYQDMGYLNRAGDASARIMARDCLLGVSLTGMADNPDIAFDYDLLRAGADMVRLANLQVAALLGINAAARLTCVKPEGTGSLVLGVGNGIHPHHSRRYLRYVEGGKATDPLVRFLARHIPDAVVQSAYNPEEVKLVFPVDLGEGPLWLKQDTAAVDHLIKVARVQESWVAPGTTRGTTTHNVSNTVQVGPDEWSHVADTIWRGRDTYAGVALLGRSGDLDYPQAPFVAVLTGDEIRAQYGDDPERMAKAAAAADLWTRLRAAWVDVDWRNCSESEDQSAGVEVVACAGGACQI